MLGRRDEAPRWVLRTSPSGGPDGTAGWAPGAGTCVTRCALEGGPGTAARSWETGMARFVTHDGERRIEVPCPFLPRPVPAVGAGVGSAPRLGVRDRVRAARRFLARGVAQGSGQWWDCHARRGVHTRAIVVDSDQLDPVGDSAPAATRSPMPGAGPPRRSARSQAARFASGWVRVPPSSGGAHRAHPGCPTAACPCSVGAHRTHQVAIARHAAPPRSGGAHRPTQVALPRRAAPPSPGGAAPTASVDLAPPPAGDGDQDEPAE